MFETRITSIISDIVDTVLIRDNYELVKGGAIKKPGIIFKLSFRASSDKTHKNLWENAIVLFTGNTSVFYAIGKETHKTSLNEIQWINSSNHDSCWNTDGLNWIDQLYFKMCQEADPNTAPINVNTICSFRIGPIFENVLVTTKSDPNNNYRRIIIKIEEKSHE